MFIVRRIGIIKKICIVSMSFLAGKSGSGRGLGRFHRFRFLLESADFLERIRPKQAAAINALPQMIDLFDGQRTATIYSLEHR
jgi:hypothetical protein